MEYKGYSDDLSLAGKVAMITGAAGGIGQAVCELFAKKGASLIIADKKAEVHELGKRLSGITNVLAEEADMTLSEPVRQTVQKGVEKFGRIDILATCSGIALMDKAEDLSEEFWDVTMNVNLKSVFLTNQAVGREMIAQGGGKIVNIASMAGVIAIDEHAAYTASKAGVIGLTKVLALEWGKYGVNVNAVSPTIVMTELGKSVWSGAKGDAAKEFLPVRRFAEPEEVAAAVLYLASDAASMVTGSNLMIDGGYTIR